MNEVDDRIAAVICTSGRPETVAETVQSLLSGSICPGKIIISAVEEADVHGIDQGEIIDFVFGEKGLTRQRNRGSRLVCNDFDIILMVDDDVIFHHEYTKNMKRAFFANPNMILAMGAIEVNGSITISEAKKIIKNIPESHLKKSCIKTPQKWGNVYGANMVFRSDFLKNNDFDERLSLYGAMEDVDIGTRARRQGDVGYHHGAICIHLRTPGARISPKQLGFSDVMNPLYLLKKGSYPLSAFIKSLIPLKPFINIARFVMTRDPSRIQRAHGNIKAISLALRGRIEPEKIVEIE